MTLSVYIEKDTPADEILVAGEALLKLAALRGATAETQAPAADTKPPKKTKAQPVTLASSEVEAPLTETLTAPVVEASAPATEVEPEAAPAESPLEETTVAEAPAALDLVAVRAILGPIMKDKKDELTALIKEYGDSLPKIDPSNYAEIVAKAKEL